MEQVYRTKDGRVFETMEEASKHEESVVSNEEILSTVKDLLNQAGLLSKQYTGFDDYMNNVTRILDAIEDDNGDRLLENYYNSNCY